jgi:hypothetical protein
MKENESGIKIIEIYGTTYKMRELTADDFLDSMDLAGEQKGYATKILLQRAIIEPTIGIDEFNKLKAKDFLKLVQAMNEMNGLNDKDFQTAQK